MNKSLESRTSGILLHPTSLPGPFAHGDLGPCSREFIDFLKASGQTWWQMLPIHPVGGSDSPYDSPSAFAGNDSLISLEDLVPLGLLDASELRSLPRHADLGHAQFALGRQVREPLIAKAHDRFLRSGNEELKASYDEFLVHNNAWVWDYALFIALRRHNDLCPWVQWSPELRSRNPQALSQAHQTHRDAVLLEVFRQFLFHFQWGKLRAFARERGVMLMGDIPMFVSHDSADVWANQGMFFLDEKGERSVQAGVPPDYFSEDGQLWGNPIYRWEVMKNDGYGWWIDRLRRELHKFDAIRLDHFIAFSRYWEIGMNATSAKQGRFVDVPGADFLRRAREALGGLPFVAEDLGLVTQAVKDLRDEFSLPGMKVLQFAFFEGAGSYLPHNHPPRSVAYLGTHDNDTTRGWYEGLLELAAQKGPDSAPAQLQLSRVAGYCGVQRTAEVNRQMLRALMASPANTAIATVQDLLDLGGQYRMNVPGVADGNWTYRIAPGQLTSDVAEALLEITVATERCSPPS
jgi:4-alpha-glucanotransferase